MPARSKTALLGLALLGLAPAASRAEGLQQLDVRSSSECPAATDVARLLRTLLLDTTINSTTERESAEVAHIEDLGDSIRVRVAERERVFEDPARGCQERARRAALFIGMVLAPPLLPDSPRPEDAPEAVEPQVTEPPPAASAWSAELGPIAQAALGSASSRLPIATGLAGRFVWHGRPALSFGAAAFMPTSLSFELAGARVTRFPLDASLRLSTGSAPVEVVAELGPLVALLFTSGERVENANTAWRAELGVRAAVSAIWELNRRWSSFVSLHGTFVPTPFALEVRPNQTAGELPMWWVGGAVGLALSGG